MDNKAKDIIKRTINTFIKNSGINYLSNIEAVNSHIFRFAKGNREQIVLEALIEYYFENIRPNENPSYLKAGGDEIFLHNLLYFDNSKGFNPKLIVPYILNGTFDANDLSLSTLFTLYSATKDNELLDKIIETNNNPKLIVIWFLKEVKQEKSLLKNETYLNVLKTLIEKMDLYRFGELLGDINRGKGILRLPTPILDIFIEKINSGYSFGEQSFLWNVLKMGAYSKELLDLFHELANKDFIPVGSNRKLIMIQSKKDGGFGYVNEDGKIIIPPIFDELSGVNRVSYEGITSIVGHIQRDKGDMKAGYYSMSKEGKVLSYSKD